MEQSPPRLKPRLEPGWLEALAGEFKEDYMFELKQKLLNEKQKGCLVYPPGPLIFEAFNSCPFTKVRVVILGQDPYHGPGQAHGLCFSVPLGAEQPPSLKNILKELSDDLGLPPPRQGDLSPWAAQGVFLLNAILSVRANAAASHQDFGWQRFTDRAISLLSNKRDHLVFMLWGRYAQAKEALIDRKRHLILKAPHPSPLSASRGFLGCRHFSKANQYLLQHSIKPIDWRLPEKG